MRKYLYLIILLATIISCSEKKDVNLEKIDFKDGIKNGKDIFKSIWKNHRNHGIAARCWCSKLLFDNIMV